jgi:hypothetical protein
VQLLAGSRRESRRGNLVPKDPTLQIQETFEIPLHPNLEENTPVEEEEEWATLSTTKSNSAQTLLSSSSKAYTCLSEGTQRPWQANKTSQTVRPP